MRHEVKRPLAFVDRAEGVLIGVQGHLGIDHQALPARNADDHVGALALAFIVGVTDLGGEIGMFAEPAAFEHVAELLLAPASARLRGIAQGIDQFRRLGRDPLGAGSHCVDLTSEQPECILALAFDLAHRLLILLQPFVNRL